MDKVTVCDLIGNKALGFTEEDRKWLTELAPEQLAKMVPKAPTTNVEVKPEVKVEPPKPVTMDELLSNASPELRESIQEGQRTLAAKKSAVIASIVANKRNVFTEDALKAKPIAELEALAALAAPSAGSADYGVRPEPVMNEGKAIEPLEVPTINWEKK